MGSSASVIETTYEAIQASTCQFKCSICYNFLSRGPIRVKVVNGSILCGRCTTVNCVKSNQLSNIFKSLQFPCIYECNGCQEKIKFDDENHEDQCRYRVFRECPSGDVHCSWTGYGREIYDHFAAQHKQLILKALTFDLEVRQDCMRSFLYKSEKYAVLLRYDFKKNTNVLRFGVLNFQFDPEPPKNYKIQFSNGEVKIQSETLYKCTPLQPYVPYFPEHKMVPYLTSFCYPKTVTIGVNIE